MKYLIGFIIAIILFFSGILVDRYYLVEPIKITEEKVEPTTWTEPQLKQRAEKKQLTSEDRVVVDNCYTHPILLVGHTEGIYLYVTASDSCKTSKARYTIRARETKHHILQAGITFRFFADPLYEIAYLYDFSFITIGGGVSIDRYNPGLKLIMQKRF